MVTLAPPRNLPAEAESPDESPIPLKRKLSGAG